MFHVLSTWIRAYPRTSAIVVTMLSLLFVIAGFYTYVLCQWRAANRAVQEQRFDDARTSLKICLAVWPRSPSVHLLAARASRLSGDFEAADDHLDHCWIGDASLKEDVDLEYLLLRVQKGDVDTVGPRLLAYVRKKHPLSPQILETLAQAYLHNLRFGPALECLDSWIEVDADRDEPYYLRGWVLEQLGNPKSAVRLYQNAITLNPEHDRARLRLAELDLQLSLAEEAQKHLDHLRKKFPDRPDILARCGRCLFLQGDLVEARRLLATAVQGLPEDLLTLTQLAHLEMKENHPDQAEVWLRRALKADPTDLECSYLLINCLEAQNRREEAEQATLQYQQMQSLLKRVNRILQEEARQSSNDAEALCDVGELYLQRGQDRPGVYWLHQALARDDQHRHAHQILAGYYERKGFHQQAAVHRRVLEEPSSSTATAP